MIQAAPTNIINETTALTTARIDTQDELFAGGLREFLQAHGCEVAVNRSPSIEPLYHIACGDWGFVKKIFSPPKLDQERRLAIIWNGNDASIDADRVKQEFHMVLIDPKPPEARLVREIFAFFFTKPVGLFDRRSEEGKTTKEVTSPLSMRQISIDEKNIPEPSLLSESDRQRIAQTINEVFPTEKLTHAPKHRQKPGSHRLRNFILTLLVILSPFIWYYFTLGISTGYLLASAYRLEQGRTDQATYFARSSFHWVDKSRSALGLFSPAAEFLNLSSIIRRQERLTAFVKSVGESQEGAAIMLGLGQNLGSAMLAPEGSPVSASTVKIVADLRRELFTLEAQLALTEVYANDLMRERIFPFSLGPVRNLVEKGETKLVFLRRVASYTDNFLAMYPRLAGFKNKQTYLVLLQNSAELRPTGGFVGSLALVTLSDGKLENLEVQDVYTVDGQLKGHVDPPQPIRELLGQEHWYLRDANWHPDFRDSAQQAAWFYDKETGQAVDGVIGINTPFITELLKATGPLELADYNERISAENFFGKSLYYTQTDFFPGSSQKKDFLGSLLTALIGKITTAKGVAPTALFRALADSLDSRDILLYFTDSELQSRVEQYRWGGALPDVTRCAASPAGESCLADFIYVVEANLSLNKVNYFITRNATSKVTIREDGAASNEVIISYRNTSSGLSTEGGGNYRSYTRVFLSPSATIEAVSLDGQPVPIRRPDQTAAEVPFVEEDKSVAGTHSVGVVFDVPPKEARQLTFSYSLGKALSFEKGSATYEWLMLKQPGVAAFPIAVSVLYPAAWKVGAEDWQKASSTVAKVAQLTYNMSLSSNLVWPLRFTK